MSQTQLVLILLSLLVLGLGAIALIVSLYSRKETEAGPNAASGINDMDRVDLARRRREFLRRYPAWATRDFQHDRTSPWHTDPEFRETAGRR
jgi:hypothetical protein